MPGVLHVMPRPIQQPDQIRLSACFREVNNVANGLLLFGPNSICHEPYHQVRDLPVLRVRFVLVQLLPPIRKKRNRRM